MNTAASSELSREILARQLTHRLASEINRALADANMSIAELAAKIGDSEGYLRRVLVGEDHITDFAKFKLLSDVAWATGRRMEIWVSPESIVEPESPVKNGDA